MQNLPIGVRAVSIVIYFLGIDQHDSKGRLHIDAQNRGNRVPRPMMAAPHDLWRSTNRVGFLHSVGFKADRGINSA